MNLHLMSARVKSALAAWLVIGASCTGRPEPREAPSPMAPEILFDAMGFGRLPPPVEPEPRLGAPTIYEGYRVLPLSFLAFPEFRTSAALWLPDGAGPFPGVLVLPGHFGEGKASGEVQDLAHALAAAGIAVFAVDPPGVEEWELPGRQLHFEGGLHARVALHAAGLSALGLQVGLARRALDVFDRIAPLGRRAVAGVSGGAVVAFYLLLTDAPLEGGVMISYVPIPREPPTGGCPCDVLPGLPGPDPRVLAALERPSLWISETKRPAPEGLPPSSRHVVVIGPHGLDARQRAVALEGLESMLRWRPPNARRAATARARPPHTPGEALRSPVEAGPSLLELARTWGAPRTWRPDPSEAAPWTASCEGTGPRILLLGAQEDARAALLAGGFAPCPILLDEEEMGPDLAIARGKIPADRVVGALAEASRSLGALAAWGQGAASIAVAAGDLPFVLQTPLVALEEVDPTHDPAWIHVPGAWSGGLATLQERALARGEDAAVLVQGLQTWRASEAPLGKGSPPR